MNPVFIKNELSLIEDTIFKRIVKITADIKTKDVVIKKVFVFFE